MIGRTDHGKWSCPGVPHKGWYYEFGQPRVHDRQDRYADWVPEDGSIEELRKEDEITCEMCEFQTIRFVHRLVHEDYPEGVLQVGVICAGNMTQDPAAAFDADQNARKRTARHKRAYVRAIKEAKEAEEERLAQIAWEAAAPEREARRLAQEEEERERRAEEIAQEELERVASIPHRRQLFLNQPRRSFNGNLTAMTTEGRATAYQWRGGGFKVCISHRREEEARHSKKVWFSEEKALAQGFEFLLWAEARS